MLSSLASDDTNFDQCGLLNPGLAVLLSKPVIGRKFDLLVTILPAQSHVCAPVGLVPAGKVLGQRSDMASHTQRRSPTHWPAGQGRQATSRMSPA